MGRVIGEVERVRDPAAREHETGLPGEERHRLRLADAKRVIRAVEQPGREQARHVARRHRPVSDPPRRGLDLDERFQPSHPARAVANDLDRAPEPRRAVLQGCRDLIRATRDRKGVARHPYASGAHVTASRISLSRSGVRRA
jgi:hypothetical protein